MAHRVALTGTPGTGKSSVAQILAHDRVTIEVGLLAERLGRARRGPEGIEVDLAGLGRSLRHRPWTFRAEVVVGHLAHLLPIRDVVVLRCHPVELGRRLAAGHRGDPHARRENMLAEALSLVTAEAVARRRTVFEVDTTQSTPARTAQRITSWMEGSRNPSRGRVDWLREPSVTEHLLEWTQ